MWRIKNGWGKAEGLWCNEWGGVGGQKFDALGNDMLGLAGVGNGGGQKIRQ